MKKAVAILLASVLILSLSACGGTPTENNSNTSTEIEDTVIEAIQSYTYSKAHWIPYGETLIRPFFDRDEITGYYLSEEFYSSGYIYLEYRHVLDAVEYANSILGYQSAYDVVQTDEYNNYDSDNPRTLTYAITLYLTDSGEYKKGDVLLDDEYISATNITQLESDIIINIDYVNRKLNEERQAQEEERYTQQQEEREKRRQNELDDALDRLSPNTD